MLKPVKALIFFTLISLTSFPVLAQLQLKLPNTSPVVSDIKKVLQDYSNQFINITGALVRENEQSSDYECTINISGAVDVFISRFPSKKNITTWEATLLITEDFEKIKQKYKNICHQFNNLSVKVGSESYKLNGVIMPVSAEVKFTSTAFALAGAEASRQKLRLEVSAQFFAPMEWRLKVLIYEKERDDEEKGSNKD